MVAAVSLNVRLRTAIAQRRAERLARAATAEGHEAVIQTVAVPLPSSSDEQEPTRGPSRL